MMQHEPYTSYANAYDALGQWRWGATLARFVLGTILPAQRATPRAALDLACGTGATALALAGAGLRVVGLDRSAAMLRVARRKAEAGEVRLALVRGDLRAFAFAGGFDLITCGYDSLNYLTDPADLDAALACVRDALAPGGVFVGDLTTRHAYGGDLDGVAHELALGDLDYRWATTWDGATGLATTTIGIRMAGAGWRTERHVQRPYAPDEVLTALERAGLRPVASYGATSDLTPLPGPPGPTAPRAIYVAARAS